MHFSEKKVYRHAPMIKSLLIGFIWFGALQSCSPLEPSGIPKRPTTGEVLSRLESAKLSFEFADKETLNLVEGIEELQLGLRIYGKKPSKPVGLDTLLDRFPFSSEVKLTEDLKKAFSLEFDENYGDLPKQSTIELDFALEKFGEKLVEVTLFDGEAVLARGKTKLMIYPGENDVNGQIKLFSLSVDKSSFDLVLSIRSEQAPVFEAKNLKPVQAFMETYCIACHANTYGNLVDASAEQFASDPESQKLLDAAVFRVLAPEGQGIMPLNSFGSQPSDAERQTYEAQVKSLVGGEASGDSNQVSLDAESFFALNPAVILNITGSGLNKLEAKGSRKEDQLVFAGLKLAPGQYDLSLSISLGDKWIEKPIGSVDFQTSPVEISKSFVFEEAQIKLSLEVEIVSEDQVTP